VIDKLQIHPPPCADEAAAIAAALSQLLAARQQSTVTAAQPGTLRYADVANGDVEHKLAWKDVARLEALRVV